MRVLVVGGGGREHALVWKLAGERDVAEVVCTPGNAGIAALARCVDGEASDPVFLLDLANREQVDFTVVGPEQPLADGVADRFAAAGRLLLGPTRAAARLESSKAYAKEFMTRHGVPTAGYRICRDAEAALDLLRRGEFGLPVVIKADGLAAGKGVVVANELPAAEQAVQRAMRDRRFGDAGATVVIEEHLSGEEASFFALCDGRRALPFPSAQDHKRAFDGDQGPNTGGMGAFAPSPLITPEVERQILARIVEPVLSGLRAEGQEYRGFLYVGLMLTSDGPQVIEFNVRLGDPEAQVVLPMLQTNLLPLLGAAASGRLDATPSAGFGTDPHVGVVVASGGYPGSYEVGRPISGLAAAEQQAGVLLFHAGTANRDGRVVTSGGRVLTVVARGTSYREAISRAYAAVDVISFEGGRVRRDIGRKAIVAG